jgi:hypothetical protein
VQRRFSTVDYLQPPLRLIGRRKGLALSPSKSPLNQRLSGLKWVQGLDLNQGPSGYEDLGFALPINDLRNFKGRNCSETCAGCIVFHLVSAGWVTPKGVL